MSKTKNAPRQKLEKVSKTCGKRRYKDEIAAKIALADIQVKDSSTRGKLEKRTYLCETCKGWHLTSWKDTPNWSRNQQSAIPRNEKEKIVSSHNVAEKSTPKPRDPKLPSFHDMFFAAMVAKQGKETAESHFEINEKRAA